MCTTKTREQPLEEEDLRTMKQGSHKGEASSQYDGQTESDQKVRGRENSADDSDAMADVSEQITQGEQLNVQLVRSSTQLSKQTNKQTKTEHHLLGGSGNTRKGNEILQQGTVVNGASQVVLVVKRPLPLETFTCLQCRRHKRCTFDARVGKIPWRRKWQPTPESLSGGSH